MTTASEDESGWCSSCAAAWAAAVPVAKRGLAEGSLLDVASSELHVLLALALAQSLKLDEPMSQLYAMLELLEDARVLHVADEPVAAQRESELQHNLTLLQSSAAVQSAHPPFAALAQQLLATAPAPPSRPTPLQLWRRQYARATPPPALKRKPPPIEPQNIWFILAPDRAPLSLHTVELGRLFKRWMVRNHPDKGGDETRASEASALYSRAMGRDAVAGKTPEDMAQEDPALAFVREQQRAEGAWSEWKRACAEQQWSASPAYVQQRLLKGFRWFATRAVKQAAYLNQLSAGYAIAAATMPARGAAPSSCSDGALSQRRAGRTGGHAFGRALAKPSLPGAPPAGAPSGDGDGPIASVLVAEHSTVEGDGLTSAYARHPGRFVIQPRDALFRPTRATPDVFSVTMRGKQTVTPRLSVDSEGAVVVEYDIAVCGHYKVHVRGGKKGVHIFGSPFTLVAKQAPVLAGQCEAEGAGLRAARAGDPTAFVLLRKDVAGRLVPKGTSRFSVRVTAVDEDATLGCTDTNSYAFSDLAVAAPPSGTPRVADADGAGVFSVAARDNGDGSFTVTYETARAGAFLLHVMHGTQSVKSHIRGSPFLLKVSPRASAAHHCELYPPAIVQDAGLHGARADADGAGDAGGGDGEHAYSVRAGRVFTLRLVARDEFSNVLRLCRADTDGADSAAVRSGRGPLPWEVSTSPPLPRVTADALSRGGTDSGRGVTFDAQLLSYPTVTFTGADGRSLPGACHLLASGEMQVRGVLFVAGRHEVTVTFGGSHVRGSPMRFNVEPAPLALHGCAVEVRSAEAGLLHATVRLRDAFGNTAAGVSGVHAFVVPASAGGAVAAGMRPAASTGPLSHGTEALMRRTLRHALERPSDGTAPCCEGSNSSAGARSELSPPQLPEEWEGAISRALHARHTVSGTSTLNPSATSPLTAAQSPHRRTGAVGTSRGALLTPVSQAVPVEAEPIGPSVHRLAGGTSFEALAQHGTPLQTTRACDDAFDVRSDRLVVAGAYSLIVRIDVEFGGFHGARDTDSSSGVASSALAGASVAGAREARRESHEWVSDMAVLVPLTVAPATLCLRHSQVVLQQAAALVAGVPFTLRVIGFDRFQNALADGGDMKLQLKQLSGPPPSEHPMGAPVMTWQHSDRLNGNHDLRVTAFRAGEYQLVLATAHPQSPSSRRQVASARSAGRVLKLCVEPSELTPANCLVRALSCERVIGAEGGVDGGHRPVACIAGVPVELQLHCYDAYGNMLPAPPDAEGVLNLTLSREPQSPPSPLPRDAKSYVPSCVGGGGAAGGSGAGAASGDFALDVTRMLPFEVALEDDGIIGMRMSPLVSGRLVIGVLLDGEHVLGSPLPLAVRPGPTAVDECEVRGATLSTTGAAGEREPPQQTGVTAIDRRVHRVPPCVVCGAGEPAVLTLVTRDIHGNQREVGGETIDATLSCEGAAMVRDLDDGTYEVHVTVMEMGVHSLSLHLGGADLPGSPFLLQCGPGAANLERSRLIAIFCGSRQLYPKMVLASSTPPTAVQGAASTLASATVPAAAPIAAPAAETSLAGLLGDSCSRTSGRSSVGCAPPRETMRAAWGAGFDSDGSIEGTARLSSSVDDDGYDADGRADADDRSPLPSTRRRPAPSPAAVRTSAKPAPTTKPVATAASATPTIAPVTASASNDCENARSAAHAYDVARREALKDTKRDSSGYRRRSCDPDAALAWALAPPFAPSVLVGDGGAVGDDCGGQSLASLPTISASAGGGPPLRFIVQLIDQYGAPTACRPSVPWQIELVPESRLNEADDPAADGGADSAADSAADGAVTGSQSPEAGERGVYALQPIVRECDEASGGNGSGADGASAGNRSLQRANVDLRCAGALRVHLSADAGTVLGPIVALLDVAPGRAHAANCVLEGTGLQRAIVGSATSFVIRAIDATGNAIRKGGERFSVIGKGPGQPVKVSVTDQKDGTYAVSYVPTSSGSYTISVYLGKHAVSHACVYAVRMHERPTSAPPAVAPPHLKLKNVPRAYGERTPSSGATPAGTARRAALAAAASSGRLVGGGGFGGGGSHGYGPSFGSSPRRPPGPATARAVAAGLDARGRAAHGGAAAAATARTDSRPSYLRATSASGRRSRTA